MRAIYPTATRANRFVLWGWHPRLLLGRDDLLAGHRVPMRWPASLAFVADVRGVSGRSPFVPWRAAAAEAVATLDTLIRQSRNRCSGTARPVWRSSAMLWGMSPPTEAPRASESTLPADTASATYDANCVDRSLVRWMLRQSPAQRLVYAQGVIDLAAAARRSRNGDR